MKEWPHTVTALSQAEILEAVNNKDWQRFRVGLKGLPTTRKLEELNWYFNFFQADKYRTERIRVDNYINALLRGGQLIREQFGRIVVQR